MREVIVLDGAGTHDLPPGDERSILGHTARHLADKIGANVHRDNWEASLMGVGGNTSWPDATHNAVIRVAHRIRTRPDTQFILLGFSAGCRPTRELLETHPELHRQIIAVGMLADPWQPHDRQQHGTPNGHGHGVMGQRLGPIPGRTFWCGHVQDPICRAASDSLLRYLAAIPDAMPGQFITTFLRKAHRGRLQLIPFLGLPLHEWFIGLGPRIDRSIREAQAYLHGGRHTVGYTEPFHTADGKTDPLAIRLADSIAWAVR